MAITPADIQAQTFSEAKRGYDPAEVDVFLERLASESTPCSTRSLISRRV